MKKIALIVLMIILVMPFSMMTGQEQLKHPPKFFNAADGKLYVNRNQPMYLFIGTSPDTKGELHRIGSESTPQYANPFYFDSEGYNSIRTPWRVDTVTKQTVYPLEDIIFEVYADGTAPVTTASFDNALKYTKDGQSFYGKGLTINLKAKDATSGIDQTYFSINNQLFTPNNEPIKFEKEGEYKLCFYSVDNVGNIENITTYNFQVDLTPPVATWTLEGDVFRNMASGTSKLVLIARDAVTDIKEIRYQINDQPVRIYKNGIDLSSLPSKEYKLRFWVEDNVGNIFEGSDGNVIVHSFFVDKTPPKAIAHVIGDQYQDKYLYVSNRSSCQLSGEDDISGLNNIIYGFDVKIQDQIYEEPFLFENKTGLQTVCFQALDMVSNRSALEKLTVYMDNEAPISRIEYTGPQFFARDTLFINKETEIKLISEDKASGVESIQYRVSNGSYKTGDQFKVESGGFHTIGFRATDKVKNQEQEKQSEIYVDNEAPDIYVNFSIKAIREEISGDEKISVYPPYVKMYIGATDRHCGTQDIFYSIDGGSKIKYTGINSPADNEFFKDEKLYEVNIEATDKLGNQSFKSIKFKVDRK